MVATRVTGEFHADGVVLARLSPPALSARMLRRPQIEALLATVFEYPLGLLVAPAGGGKSLALAALVSNGGWPAAWCRLSTSDDPASLVAHLAASFRSIRPLDEAALQATFGSDPSGASAIALLSNQLTQLLDDETLLVLDDLHLADAHPVLRDLLIQLIELLPLRLHVMLLSRVAPQWTVLDSANLRGDVLLIDWREIGFSRDEAADLFTSHNHAVPDDLDELLAFTGGWPLVLRAALPVGGAVQLSAAQLPSALSDYLEREVLAALPPAAAPALAVFAALREIDPVAAKQLCVPAAVDLLLESLRRRQLVQAIGSTIHLHPVVLALVQQHAARDQAAWAALHRRAAAYFQPQHSAPHVLHHLLAAGDGEAALLALAELAPQWLERGAADDLLRWIERLPPAQQTAAEALEVQAAALRRLGRFDTALKTYHAAEVAYAVRGDQLDGQVRALRGQAEIFLDTVQPAPAVAPLRRALKLLPRDRLADRALLVRLQAENWANRGRADVALLLEATAQRMERGESRLRDGHPLQLPPRLLLRGGRLHEARVQLEATMREMGNMPLGGAAAHREPALLLALMYAMLGSGPRALAMARRGLLEAQQGDAPLTEAIAHLRLGHAYQLVAGSDINPAAQCYHHGMRLIQSVGVSRTRAEALLGLTLLHGHSGDLAAAEGYAREGLQISQAAGDEWLVGLLLLALGGAAVATSTPSALEWLDQAEQRFVRGGDLYGITMTTLWRALWHIRAENQTEANQAVAKTLELAATHGYESVLCGASMFGPRDLAMLVPLLLRGRGVPQRAGLAQQLLRQGFPTIAADDTVEDYHPGYTLRVQMLGTFRVWRGWQEIHAREWQREKARQLFQLLLTHRGMWLQREQICAYLWPESDLEAAERQFKVTLNALNTALEPGRPSRIAPFFIRRQGLAYSFAPSFGAWIDVDEFELRGVGANADDREFAMRSAQIAVQIYRGDYLAESLYDAWTIEERERLLARYLGIATTYAAQMMERGEYTPAIQLCERVLRRDRCYEEAYQLLIRAHSRSGSRSQAFRSYTRCVQSLQEELGIEPLPETVALYERLKRNEPI